MSSVRYFLGRDFQPAAAAAAYFGELEEALIHGGIDPGMIKSDAQTTKQCKLLRSTSQLACLLFLLSLHTCLDRFCRKGSRFLLAAQHSTGTGRDMPRLLRSFPFLCNTVAACDRT
jgi:hypothetical protein